MARAAPDVVAHTIAMTGTLHVFVTFAKGTGWMDTSVVTLRDGPHTSSGTVALTGFVKHDACYFCDEVCTLAVTGGTGAYENVRGHATVERIGEGLRMTLSPSPESRPLNRATNTIALEPPFAEAPGRPRTDHPA